MFEKARKWIKSHHRCKGGDAGQQDDTDNAVVVESAAYLYSARILVQRENPVKLQERKTDGRTHD
ncbi:MAG: hypothetical protein ETSY2_30500 [Candidatus Entotheonella gemina]|uniref:Uncharacterized protein n=1 Tax=Candidatus Entotheonella gemina TaxID=1429439 RepID=W4M1W8_9BACT|nr:MAG: hypothetical protein ETSY2_30500 [Candidatus Entotheonella gemina]